MGLEVVGDNIPQSGLNYQSEAATIYLVEDDDSIRPLLKMILEGTDYHVEDFPDGQAGYRAAIAKRPDLILSDLKMPLMDGLEFIKSVDIHYRQVSESTHIPYVEIPFILMTANHTGDPLVLEFQRRGRGPVLYKPFSALGAVPDAVSALLAEKSFRFEKQLAG